MMKYLTLSLAVLAFVAFAGLLHAADAKPATVTVKGTLECSKCALKETTECGNVLAVKEGDKEVKYYLVDNETSKTNHKNVCTVNKSDVSVTGTVEDKAGKKWITATKIDFPEAAKSGT